MPNPHLDYLIDPNLQRVNRLFVLSSEDSTYRAEHREFYLPKVEVKDYNVTIDGRNFFHQTVKCNLKTYDNIRKLQQVKKMITQLVFY